MFTPVGYFTSVAAPGGITATGGTISTFGDYKVHTFTSNGTFQVTDGSGVIEYLLVGGGAGGGGTYHGAGGGAGGVFGGVLNIPGTGAYTITVGAGGAGGYTLNGVGATGVNGNPSSIVNSGISVAISASGGGGGAGFNTFGGGVDGASGGGGADSNPLSTTTQTGGSGDALGIIGNDGGDATPFTSIGWIGGGGGGGAMFAGRNGFGNNSPAGSIGGDGGDGKVVTIAGTQTYYGGGGAGSHGTGGTQGTGGQGGGANGSDGIAFDATANTGGGGGGAERASGIVQGGDGGSGIVIIRYRTAGFSNIPVLPTGSYNTNYQDGLILDLNASDSISAPQQSEAYWYDVSPRQTGQITKVSSPTLTTGGGGYWTLNGTSDKFTFGNSNNLFTMDDNNLQLTLEVVFRAHVVGSERIFLSRWGNNNNIIDQSYKFGLSSANIGGYSFTINDSAGANQQYNSAGSLMTTNTWYHLVWQLDFQSSRINAWQNNSQIITNDLITPITDIKSMSAPGQNWVVNVGGNQDGSGYFDGDLGIVRVYNNKLLTTSEITQNYNYYKGLGYSI